MHLAGEACHDTGRPSISRRALSQMPKVEQTYAGPQQPPIHSLEINPTLLSPWSGGADATFCKHCSIFYLARILVSGISPGS